MADDEREIADAEHPSGTHAPPGAGEGRPRRDDASGEEEIVGGRNPTQRAIDEREREEPDDRPVVPPESSGRRS